MTKLGTYLVLKRIWNPIDFQGQGHQVKFLGKGIHHALRCPCLICVLSGVFSKFLEYKVILKLHSKTTSNSAFTDFFYLNPGINCDNFLKILALYDIFFPYILFRQIRNVPVTA